MKKKSTSQSAFFSLRVLIGLFVFGAGVFLALFSFGPATTGFAQGTTREQLAIALAQALAIQPPACVPGQEMFNDVPASSPFCPFIEELARRGITGGCGGGNYCPGDPVTRAQMAVFIVKATSAEAFHEVGAPGEPGFKNGWANVGSGGSTAAFYKDPLGVVHLKGNVFNPASTSSVAFTLPPGYRPSQQLLLPVAALASGSPTGSLVILPAGDVIPQCDVVNCSIGIDGLAFRAP
jgi:S-layer homology domain